ncbi:MAG: lamin tail domain-containing protein [Bacteroidales bacterium]|nr:lamin tail domain-containing protein [Bacteroidales bacterium]
MKKRLLIPLMAAVILAPAVFMAVVSRAQGGAAAVPPRPEGPCDIYASGGTPCAAAHSTTRALYKDYDGPLYQVIRQSDGATLDIGVVPSRRGEEGGYANAAAQDAFCADTYCFISIIYDQSPQKNHLIQAPRGYVIGPAMGGMDNVPLADLAPVTLNGHKVYGTFIIPGMGMRWNDPTGTAVDDQAEGQYWVINGHHYSDGCCFDYGNAETDSTDDGDGTMETTYFGIKNKWYHGDPPGPWLMTDQENNLVGCVNEDPNDKYCETLKSITWRFVTQMVDGAPHRWRSMGGNAQEGPLEMLYDGGRIKNERSSYDPMRKQGAILLGNGGDNGNVSSGTFYEGAMTFAGTFPSEATNQAVQANIVAAKYDVPMLEVASAASTDAPAGLQTWAPGTTQNVTVKFTNTIGETVVGLTLTVVPPKGWKYNVQGSTDKVQSFRTILPGESVYATFAVTSSMEEFNGDINAKANWNSFGKTWSETAHSKVRNVQPVKINEFRIADNKGNATNSFIELYNASDKTVDISGWTVMEHSKNIPFSSYINVPSGTKLQPKTFYLIGLSNSGLAVDAAKGDATVYVRTLEGMSEGDEVIIGTGKNAEKRRIKAIVNTLENPMRAQVTPSNPTFVFQPLPNGPDDRQFERFPAGSRSIPVISVANVKVGQKLAIGYGAKYPHFGQTQEKFEVVTVTNVGKPGTHAYTSYESYKGETVLRVSSVNNITPGDKILLDIDSEGHGKELVTVKSVGTASARRPYNGPMTLEQAGTGITLTAPLKYNHSANVPFSVLGTGISFTPATKYDHYSNEPVFALVYALVLDEPLAADHPIDDVVYDAKVKTAGYQDAAKADLLFGGPALQPNGGTIVLRDSRGLVVDALNYGRVLDSQYAEGYHAESGVDAMGSLVMTPYVVQIDGYHNPINNVQRPDLSAGRFPDGYDTDNNKYDFRVQPYFHLATDTDKGGQILVVSSIDGLSAGQKVYIGGADNCEQAVLATVGIKYGDYDGMAVGLSAPLKMDHKSGEAVSVNIPTPGAPNRY